MEVFTMARPKKTTTDAKTTTAAAKETVAKKPAARAAKAVENVFIQANGGEITAADLVSKAKEAAGVKTAKSVNYVIDDATGDFPLF
jgi:hypothetical protein